MMTKAPRSAPATTAAVPRMAEQDRKARELADRQSELLDEALQETFPASDPVSVVRLT